MTSSVPKISSIYDLFILSNILICLQQEEHSTHHLSVTTSGYQIENTQVGRSFSYRVSGFQQRLRGENVLSISVNEM